MAEDCVFCGIAAGEAEASVVHEGERTVAFMDRNPIAEGHVLVVPRGHAEGLSDLDPAVGGRLFEVGQRVAAGLRASLDAEGVNLFLADGEAAGQELFHAHLHVIPRAPEDGISFITARSRPDREDLDATAERIRTGL
jgi:diadenosine tetraphosphate (Ap4A) HIT family hydrolase